MNHFMNILPRLAHAALVMFLISVIPVTAEEQPASASAAAALEINAKVVGVDPLTRELNLDVQYGLRSTLFIPKRINMDSIHVGDHILGTYYAAQAMELRKPTDEELADPWQVIEESTATGEGIDSARTVRAVVTILAVDKDTGIIVVADSRDMMHFIVNSGPEEMTGLKDGQRVVVVFREAMALTIEKKS